MTGGKIQYSLSDTSVVIKLIGKITWDQSIELNALFQCIMSYDTLKTAYIDCSDTSYMDSTMLGILVHFKRRSEEHGFHVVISSPSEICDGLFNDVGLNKVFDIRKEPPPELNAFRELPLGKDVTTTDIEELIKEAHEELMRLNEKNRALFSPVVNIFNIKNKRKI